MKKLNKLKLIKRIILGSVGTIVLFLLVLIGNLIVFEKNASRVSAGKPIANYDISNPALLIIDIQEATTGEVSLEPYYMQESARLINNVNTLIDRFREQDLPVIYIRSEISNPLINLLNSSYAKGSLGTKLDRRLKVVSEFEVVKNSNDSFFNTLLDSVLETHQINHLYLVGLDAAHCINITIQAAQRRNYTIELIREAVLSESIEMRDSMFIEFEKQGIEISTIDNVKP